MQCGIEVKNKYKLDALDPPGASRLQTPKTTALICFLSPWALFVNVCMQLVIRFKNAISTARISGLFWADLFIFSHTCVRFFSLPAGCSLFWIPTMSPMRSSLRSAHETKCWSSHPTCASSWPLSCEFLPTPPVLLHLVRIKNNKLKRN